MTTTERHEVTCPKHGNLALTPEQYQEQLEMDYWLCPICAEISKFVEPVHA